MASGKYRTIVADPPWPSMTNSQWPLPYPSMSLAEIEAMPVRDMAENDTTLFLWTTNGFLPPAFDVLDRWGFKYSTTLTWCKTPQGTGFGSLFAVTTEFILVARIGHPNRERRRAVATSWFDWPRGAHSAKPEAFLDMVETVSPGPYLELFARRNRLGWDTYGNESLNMVDLGASDG